MADKLLIDVGNTRIKHCWTDERISTLSPFKAYVYSKECLKNDIQKIFKNIVKKPASIYVSNVLGKEIEKQLSNYFLSAFDMKCHFAKTHSSFLNIRNGYRQPKQLGIDRWLQCIAAATLYPYQTCIIISFGTVITVDIINEKAQHLGGYILPSLSSMVKSISSSTYGCQKITINLDLASLNARSSYPQSTTDGIKHGALNMLKTFLLYEIKKLKNAYPDMTCILSGGDAKKMQSFLEIPAQVYLDFVLQGLAVYAKNQ